jgi:hypothetical protein
VTAVIVIFKCATILQLSNLTPESALTQAELYFQEANMDLKIEQHLTASSQVESIEKFGGFIMNSDLGLFVLAFIMIVSHHVCAESLAESTHSDLSMPAQSSVHGKDHWYKQVLGSMRKATRKDE